MPEVLPIPRELPEYTIERVDTFINNVWESGYEREDGMTQEVAEQYFDALSAACQDNEKIMDMVNNYCPYTDNDNDVVVATSAK